ncbi:MAG TPA: PDZ domain-containing protein [Deltaproteobacteria bacterium]|nr:PDZ domain-containing protein [Deltaproteobacteria bacterium]
MHNLMLLSALAQAKPVVPPTPVADPEATYNPLRSFAPLVEAVQPAVVTIEISSKADLTEIPSHMLEMLEMLGLAPEDVPHPSGEGSGFIIDPSGLMLTNHHVIANADEITIVLHDGTKTSATPIGSDAAMDIALLQLPTDRDWPSLQLGDSDDLQVGDWVLAMGNALGLGTTATSGIVSGKGRVLGHDVFGREDFIQTDAAINQGNSGGPLFDLEGRVVGMNTAIIAGANTVGFSIPSALVQSVLEDLKTHGRVARGFLGVQPQTLDADLKRALGVEATTGAVVANVFEDTPASQFGLKTGDVVVGVDGAPIETETDLISAISGKRPGERVQLEIERDQKRQHLRIVLTERPVDEVRPGPAPLSVPHSGDTVSALGLTLAPLSPAIAADVGVRKGVLVERIARSSPAYGRLQPGDIIIEVNRRPVDEPKDIERILARTTGSAFLLVLRDDAQQFVAMPLP